MSTTTSVANNSRAMRVKLFFDQTSDEKFLVLSEMLSSGTLEQASHLSIHTFEHEDRFLERLIYADLPVDDTSLMAGIVIRSVGESMRNRTWMELTLTADQIETLGLDGERVWNHVEETPSAEAVFEFGDNSSQFYQFLMRSPTPFVMFGGPEHRFTFINRPYAELIGGDREEFLMKPFHEALPELEGQPFLKWLDEVYKTGVPHVGSEQLAYIRRQDGRGFDDRYFDFIYYPVRNAKGAIYGVMAQAAEVTDRVRDRAVSEHREETLFRQWAELDSIYRMAPVGMALLDAKSMRLLRINEKQAEIMGASVAELVGKRVLELDFVPPALAKLYKRVEAGETVRNAIVEKAVVAGATGHRTWLVNISPFPGASGEALAFTSISLEIPDEP